MNLKFKFLPFVACFSPACALLHVLYYPPHTHVFATSLSTLPLRLLPSICLSPFLPSLFATTVCASLIPLCLKDGYTALIAASVNDHTATVELLLGAGADTEAKDKVSKRMKER